MEWEERQKVMFGYISANQSALDKQAQARYRAYYCGLCRALKERHGQIGRMTLSNDLTFLFILLSSLYEPKETLAEARCALHPVKRRTFLQNEFSAYAADMNLLLSYYKALDNKKDEHDPAQGAAEQLLRKRFRRVRRLYPQKCECIGECIERIGVLEDQKSTDVDALCNLSGIMLGEVFACRDDHWTPILRQIGAGLGRFVYFMDAYEDYQADRRAHRFNPLTALHEQPDYEALCRQTLTLLIADATEAFELLPLEKDIDILRNVLYSGVWAHYARMHRQEKEQTDGQ